MSKLTEMQLERLDRFLCALDDDDAMLISELDGFLAGIVVCPDLIRPSEWMPAIWGNAGPVFETQHEANEILGLIMAHYNEIARGLGRKGKYAPILDIDRDGSLLWEIWGCGFAKAIELSPVGWIMFEEADNEDVFNAFGSIATIAEMAKDGHPPSKELADQLRANASEFFADCLELLNHARRAAHPQTQNTIASPSAGRNDPCPCGSGKKFKKCCLH